MTKITYEQFMEYEECRLEGLYNMFDQRARLMTSLSGDRWYTIMKNYEELSKRFFSENIKEN